ncbi:MAG: hypothetical protein IAE78_09520 [Myxococcus sp.]|nr:hypothetical protein [Myxococcus sp.]
MRWLIVGGVLVVLLGAMVAWPFVAVKSVPARLEAAAVKVAERFSVADAERFAEAYAAELKLLGVVEEPGGLTVTMSRADPTGDGAFAGIERSVSVKVACRRPALMGLFSLPVKTTLQVRGVVVGGTYHASSQWPAGSEPLPLLAHTSGRAAVVAEPPLPERQFVWSTASADSTVSIISVEAKGGCELRCEQADGGVKWSSVSPCRVRRSDLRFVSRDCERMVAIDPSPITARYWENTVVATVFKGPQVAYEINAVTLVTDIAKVRASHGWLRGLSDFKGAPPAYGPDGGTVEFGTADGRTHSVPLAVE